MTETREGQASARMSTLGIVSSSGLGSTEGLAPCTPPVGMDTQVKPQESNPHAHKPPMSFDWLPPRGPLLHSESSTPAGRAKDVPRPTQLHQIPLSTALSQLRHASTRCELNTLDSTPGCPECRYCMIQYVPLQCADTHCNASCTYHVLRQGA